MVGDSLSTSHFDDEDRGRWKDQLSGRWIMISPSFNIYFSSLHTLMPPDCQRKHLQTISTVGWIIHRLPREEFGRHQDGTTLEGLARVGPIVQSQSPRRNKALMISNSPNCRRIRLRIDASILRSIGKQKPWRNHAWASHKIDWTWNSHESYSQDIFLSPEVVRVAPSQVLVLSIHIYVIRSCNLWPNFILANGFDGFSRCSSLPKMPAEHTSQRCRIGRDDETKFKYLNRRERFGFKSRRKNWRLIRDLSRSVPRSKTL